MEKVTTESTENLPVNSFISNSVSAVSRIYDHIHTIWCALSAPAPPRSVRFALKVTAWIMIVLYGFVPYVILNFDNLGRTLLFMTFIRRHPLDFTHPETSEIIGIRNFYVNLNEDELLGVWHILPKGLLDGLQETEEFYNEALKKKYPIFLYFHGITGSRATPHRITLYKVLQKMDCHVLAFDYRGFGDSSEVEQISESTLVEDGKCMILWAEKNTGESPFYTWGHSLGAAVMLHTMYEITDYAYQPQGVVIESTFNNMFNAMSVHPLNFIYQWIPFYQSRLFLKLVEMDLLFKSDQYIGHVKLPLLMLHAKDDGVIPCHLALQLYEYAIKTRNALSKPVKLLLFSGKFDFGHRNIIMSQDLPKILHVFFTQWSDTLKGPSLSDVHNISYAY